MHAGQTKTDSVKMKTMFLRCEDSSAYHSEERADKT